MAYRYTVVFLKRAEVLAVSGKFTSLDKLLVNKLMEHVKTAKYVPPYGIETLIGYFIAKDNEIKIARIILAGKTAGISPERIKERLRETYV